MKSIVNVCVLVVVCWMGLARAESAFVDFDLQWAFPEKLAGIPYEKAEKYDDESFGYSVYYGDDKSYKATVTIYTLGRTDIPDGCAGDGIEMVLESVGRRLEQQMSRIEDSSFRKRGSSIIPKAGDIQFASTMYQYAESSNKQKLCSVYATGKEGRFIKLEFTFDLINGSEARGMADEMIKQLIGMVKGGLDENALLLEACSAFQLDPGGHGGRVAAKELFAAVQTMGDLNVYTHLFAWPDGYRKPKNTELLIAGYFAGMLQVVLPEGLESGGECEGFIAMLDVYNKLRAKEQIKPIAEFDKWAGAADKNALFEALLIDESSD